MILSINDLIAATNLNDRTDRLMLADALEEAGRGVEARRLRRDREVALEAGEILRVSYEIRYVGAPYGIGEAGELISLHWRREAAEKKLHELRKDARYYGSNTVMNRVLSRNLSSNVRVERVS